METLETIKNRRSIRKFKADPVDEKTVETVLDAARLAPSWANTQCWKFVVVRDAQTKSALADSIIPNPTIGSNPAINGVRIAPVVIVALAEKGLSGCYSGRTLTVMGEYWFLFDVALALENLALAATSMGLGTVHVGLFDHAKVARILSVPDNYYVVTMVPLGYPEFQPNPRPRKPLNEVVYYEKFGASKQ
jgi:nitroreductase